MLKVFKYPIKPDDYFEVSLPQGSQILTVDNQFENPNIWALVDPEKPMVTRTFRLAGTGHPIDHTQGDLFYHGTIQLMGGALIFHLFELMPFK